jgi:dipeptidyl-peptidase-4
MGHKLVVKWKTHQVKWVVSSADEGVSEWNPASKATAYVESGGHQLFVRSAEGTDTQLTTDGSRDIVYGQSVHRDEFGISKGLYWSPYGTRLAFYRMDQTAVSDYPLVDIPDPSWTPSEGSRIATLPPRNTRWPGRRATR